MIVSYDTEKIDLQSPTIKQIATLQDAFDIMNERLFEGALPKTMINQVHKRKSHGYFAREKWKVKGGTETLHEININPHSMERSNKLIFSTLLHEMAHLWQTCYGHSPRTGYHNRQWAEKMLSIGLKPVSLDKKGYMTGQRVTHEIIPGGKFDKLFAEVQFKITYYVSDTRIMKEKKERKNKIKYMCPGCKSNLWGKPEMSVRCNECGTDYVEQPASI